MRPQRSWFYQTLHEASAEDEPNYLSRSVKTQKKRWQKDPGTPKSKKARTRVGDEWGQAAIEWVETIKHKSNNQTCISMPNSSG